MKDKDLKGYSTVGIILNSKSIQNNSRDTKIYLKDMYKNMVDYYGSTMPFKEFEEIIMEGCREMG